MNLKKNGVGKWLVAGLLTLSVIGACKKEVMLPKPSKIDNANGGQSIKPEKLQNWLAINPFAKYLSLDWKKATQASKNGKNIVRVPLLNIDKTKAMAGIGPVVKGQNTNYNEKQPPEIYFVEDETGKLHTHLLNFIPEDPSKDNGGNGITGKLCDWNMKGDTVFVLDLVKGKLKESYALKGKQGVPNNSPLSAALKNKKLQSLKGVKDKQALTSMEWFIEYLAYMVEWAGYWNGSTVYITGYDKDNFFQVYRLDIDWYNWLKTNYNEESSGHHTLNLDEQLIGEGINELYVEETYFPDQYDGYEGRLEFTPYAFSPVKALIYKLDLADDTKLVNFLNSDSGSSAVLNVTDYLDYYDWGYSYKTYAAWALRYFMENPSADEIEVLWWTYDFYELEEIANALEDPITGNGIELYLIVKYRGNKSFLLASRSTSNTFDVGSYTLTPFYSGRNEIIFYSALRHGTDNGVEYLIRADQLNNFRTNLEYYRAAADLVYMNGIPSEGMIQLMAGDRVKGLLNLWGDAIKSPEYWAYLGTTLLYSATLAGEASALAEAKSAISSPEYSFTQTAADHLKKVVTRGLNKGQPRRPFMNSPLTIQEIMATGPGVPDAPAFGSPYPGGFNWRVSGSFRGSNGTWELGINPQTRVIYHFNFVE